MLELAIWLYHIGTPDLAVRIATDVATVLFLLWGHPEPLRQKGS